MNRAVVLRAAAGLVAYLQTELRHPRAVGRRGVRRPVQLRRLRARHRGRRGRRRRAGRDPAAAAADAGAGVRDPAPRRRRGRHGHGEPQPAAGQRLQGLPRRRQPDRAADRRADRRRTSPRSRRCATCRSSTTAGRTSATRCRTPTSTRVAAIVPSEAPTRPVSVVHTALHGVGDDTVRRVFAAAGFAAPTTGDEPGRAGPGLPDGELPEPRGGRRDRRGPRPGARGAPRRRHRQRPRRRPVRGGGARRRRFVADAARRRGGCPARSHASMRARRRSRTPCSPARSCRPGCSPRWPRRRASGTRRRSPGSSGSRGCRGWRYGYEEALGYCVDAGHRPRQGRRQRRSAPRRAGRGAQGPGPHAPRRARRPSRSRHGVYATDAFSVRVDDLAEIPPVMERLRSAPPRELGAVSRSPRSTTWLAATAGCRRPTACATSSPTARASSCGRPAPSPSSRSTSRPSSRWATSTGSQRPDGRRPSGWRPSATRWRR